MAESSAQGFTQRLRGVVFDLDDTLVTAVVKKAEMWARTVEHIREVLPEVDGDELRRRAVAAREVHYGALSAGRTDVEGFRRAQLAEAVAPWGRLPEETVARCLREREAATQLCAGAEVLIEQLHGAGLRVGVLTNGPSSMQRRKLAVTGLDRWLDAVAISGEIGASKPEKSAYVQAAELLDCLPEETAMVGDRLEWDVEGPLRADYRRAILVGEQAVALPRGAVQVDGLKDVLSCLLPTSPGAGNTTGPTLPSSDV